MKYKKIKKIGSGSYSNVYKSVDSDGKVIALKKLGSPLENGILETTLREMAILQHCHHKNVIKHYDLDLNNFRLISFPLYEMDMRRFIHDSKIEYSFEDIRSICRQLVQGLKHLHLMGFIHRDIKPQNILISRARVLRAQPYWKTVIADLGLTKNYVCTPEKSRNKTPEVVTLWYRAPEILLGDTKYSKALDMWSVGCIIPELYTKKVLFAGNSELDQLLLICKAVESTIPINIFNKQMSNHDVYEPELLRHTFKEIEPQAVDLTRRLLVFDCKERANCIDTLNHTFLSSPVFAGNSISSEQQELELRINNMKTEEQKYGPWVQSEVTIDMRHIVIDWMIEVVIEADLSDRTLFRAVMLLDKYIQKQIVYKKYLQLVGIVGLLLASKLEEPTHLELPWCSYITDNTYAEEELVIMEKSIVKVLEARVYFPMPVDFILTTDKQKEIRQLLYLVNFDYHTSHFFLPHEIADSIVHICCSHENRHNRLDDNSCVERIKSLRSSPTINLSKYKGLKAVLE